MFGDEETISKIIEEETAKVLAQESRPKIVCLCGSTRFIGAFQKANLEETLAGNIVLSVGCNTKSDVELFSGQNRTEEFRETKRKLDELHKRKIDLADEVFVLNVCGYIGESTRSEIEYAENLGKPIRYLVKDLPLIVTLEKLSIADIDAWFKTERLNLEPTIEKIISHLLREIKKEPIKK